MKRTAMLLVFVWTTSVGATPPSPPKDPTNTATSTSHAGAAAKATAQSAADSSSRAESGGNSLSVESNYEGSQADLVLVPNNNTESCLRVFGLAFGNKNGSGMIGVPWRSYACDLEAAADDAFAQGNLVLGWTWKCKMRASVRAFGSEEACVETTTQAAATQAELLRLRAMSVEQDKKIKEFASRAPECERNERIVETCGSK